jgi:uncharacterized protein
LSLRDANYWIDKLQLRPHPEGGYYRETYRADLAISQSELPSAFNGDRSVCTGIYFLLADADFSAFHRIASDEMWHFYAGDSLSIYVIDKQGGHSEIKLGPNSENGDSFQAIVPAGCWFASRLVQPGTFALAGCTVSPGFNYHEFEMADRAQLIRLYPLHKEIIEQLTRDAL